MTLNNELKARFITSVSMTLIERCYQFVELDYKLLIGRVLKLIMICLGAAVGLLALQPHSSVYSSSFFLWQEQLKTSYLGINHQHVTRQKNAAVKLRTSINFSWLLSLSTYEIMDGLCTLAPAGHQETIVNENQLVEMMMMTVETSCETS